MKKRLAKFAAVIAGHCERRYQSLIWPYTDGQLDAEQVKVMEAHLVECALCREEYEELRFAMTQVAQLKLPEAVPANSLKWLSEQKDRSRESVLSHKAFSWRWAVTAAVMLLLLAGTLTWYFRKSQVESWDVTRLAGQPKVGTIQIVSTSPIKVGDWIETDHASRARIRVGSIGYVEVEQNSQLQLLTAKTNEHRLALTRGKMHASILAPPRLFFINTPSATVVDYGCAYTLEVDESGASLLRVTAGWVSLQSKGRESMAPAGAMCYARPPQGPGTPFFEDASEKFQHALEQFDFSGGGVSALTIVLAEARPRDGLSLFHLLQSVADTDKERVYERLVALVPLPEGVTRADVLQHKNALKLAEWREKIDYVSVGVDPSLVPKNTGTLQPTGTLNDARYTHTATLLNDGRVLVAGGLERDGKALDSTEIYDPARGRFTIAGRLTTKRVGHTATLLNDGRVLITGGSDNTFYFGALASAEIYDPRTNSFRAVGSMHEARLAHRATLLPDGKVLITGGQDAIGDKLIGAELYDPTTDTFSVISPMNAKRDDHTATLLKNGLVLIAGGGSKREPDERPQASAELYDPATQKFVMTGSMSVPRYKHSAAMLPDGRVLIMGGSDARMWAGRYASAEIYDPASGKFTATANLNTARYKIRDAVVTLPNGKILVAGGGARPEVFDPGTGVFAPVAGSLGTTRYYATATLLENGDVLILGGYLSDERSGMEADLSAWLYRP